MSDFKGKIVDYGHPFANKEISKSYKCEVEIVDKESIYNEKKNKNYYNLVVKENGELKS